MADVTAFGSSVTIMSLFYPMGITVNESDSDVALFEVDDPEFGTVQVGLNGHKISWVHGSVYTVRIGVIPNGDNDKKLKAMVAGSRPQLGASLTIDSVQVIFTEGVSGNKSILADCTMTSGAICNVTTTAGRFAARVYTFQGTVQAW